MGKVFTKERGQIQFHLQLPNVKTVKYGIESVQYIGHHLWASIPEEIKNTISLTNFKQKINHGKEVLAFAGCTKLLLME